MGKHSVPGTIDATTRLAIEALVHEHAWLIDHGEAARLPALYADDGQVLGIGLDKIGQDAICAWANERAAMTERRSRHVQTNVRLAWRSEGRIDGTVVLSLFRHDGGGPAPAAPMLVGEYDDSLAAEGGAHQSIATPLIGMAQDGLTSFEPAFADELAVLMRWAFEHIQAPSGQGKDRGGSVYLCLSTRAIEQPQRSLSAVERAQVCEGGYWLRRPGPNAKLVIAYTGAVAPEAIRATGLLGEDRRDIGLLSITSADRLHRDWIEAEAARESGASVEPSPVQLLLAGLPRDCGLVTVLDGHPATLAWLGGVYGHRTRALGVTRFGQTGTLADVYRAAGIDSDAIAAATLTVSPGRQFRHAL